MRAVVQRVKRAEVTVDGTVVGAIPVGLVVLLGVGQGDAAAAAAYLAEKTARLRIFPDQQDKMNLDVLESGGSILVVSQFTLYGDVRKGRRPAFDSAASPELARELYENYISRLREMGLSVATGRFQASMEVSLTNWGPVTILLDSHKLF